MKKLIFSLLVFISLLITACAPQEVIFVPTLSTVEITNITSTTANCGGTITFYGGATVTASGVCWSTNPNPTIANSKTTDGAGKRSFISTITGLAAGTTYFVRAYATNSAGTGYGGAYSFTTLDLITFNPNLTYGTVTDIDGNVYKTITIGTQTWMAENLRTTKYRDGTIIPNTTDNTVWYRYNLNTPAYCWYGNDVLNNKNRYGALYNWYVVNTGKLAPTGWHVPTDAEWTTLTTFLGGVSVAGDKLKEEGTVNWYSQNTNVTNLSGFTALPCGHRSYDNGAFYGLGSNGYWWSSTEYDTYDAWYRFISYNFVDVYSLFISKRSGFSVRCVRD